MTKLFRKLDPRLASDLRSRRRTIVKGLLCVLVTSLMTAATIPLIKECVNSIMVASRTPSLLSGSGGESALTNDQIKQLAQEVQVPETKVGEAVRKLGAPKQTAPETVRREAVNRLGLVCLLVLGLFLLKYWFTRGQAYYLSKAGAELAADLRHRLFRKLQRLPITYFNDTRAGRTQSILTNDVNVYQGAINIIRDSIDGPIKAAAAFVTILVMQWQLAVLAVLFVPILFLIIQYNGRKMKSAQAQVQEDLGTLNAFTHEAIQGTRVIKAFGAETQLDSTFFSLLNATFRSQLKAARRLSSLRPMVELIGAAALAAVLYACGWLAFRGSLVVSDIIALTYALDVINQGFRSMGHVSSTYNQVQAASDRIYGEILELPEEHSEQAGLQIISSPRGHVEFRDVSFRYPDGSAALSNVSFSIEPCQSLALVGPSGAGKSTIADLLLRFYDPTSGQILYDGVDIRELKLDWYRSQIGVVPQQTFLFAGSIADNLKMGHPEATHEELRAAAQAAHALSFIETDREGFDSELGERGVRLSGGEMQRLAIARALIRKPTVLVLDEATSNLDSVSEKAVTEALEELMHTRTTLFIAHRLSTAARADRILVLRRGEILETGSHKSLLEQNGVYAGMFRAYSSGVLVSDL